MMTYRSFRLFILGAGVGLAFLPFQAFAQVGPCPASGTCPSGQTCLTRAPSTDSMCFKLCTPDSSTPGECPAGSVCGASGTGENICTPIGSGTTGGDTTSSSETPAAPPTETAPAAPFVSITPQLNVDIPGVEFTPAVKSGDSVYIPFLAQYISGAYRYAVGIVLVIAIIMVAWGGFRYLLGSGFEDITRGKEIIRDALAGMLLVIGAYLILQTINPATLDLSVLKLGNVTEQSIELSQNSTTVDTRPDGSYPDAPASTFGECPVVLSTAVTDMSGRRTEYLSKVNAIVGTGDIRDRVLRVAEASAKCGVSLGSCGKTATTIFEQAGHSYRDTRGRQTHHEPSGMSTFLDGIKCEHGMARDARRTCARNAKQQAFARMSSEVSGWPEAWTNELQNGDRIVIFNANSSVAGLHSAVFMGWAGAGRARVVQGAWRRLVNEGTICLTSACSNPSPLIRIFQPVDE